MKANCPICGRRVGHDGAHPAAAPVRAAWFRPSFFPHWQAECEAAAFSLCDLVVLAGRRWSASASMELLRSLPRLPQTLDDCDPSCMARRYLADAQERLPGPRYDAALAGLKRIAALDDGWRTLLEASFAGLLVGWGTSGP